MKFFLYVPGMPFDGELMKQAGFSLGGSESMGYYMAKGLAQKGHSVFVFCNIPDNQPKLVDGVNYIPIGKTSQQFPFGVNFERYAMDIPCDVLLGQRNPGLFAKPYNAKLTYWWSHDLALKRFQPHINAMIWNIDRFLGVSDFHKEQIQDVYMIDDDYAGVLPNGIDLDLWPLKYIDPERKQASKQLLYSSRPERGLVNLVGPGGIMDQLLKIDPEITLQVAGYDNTTEEMAGMYQQLFQRCEEMPNVQNLGHLSKEQLAIVQTNVWLHVYPTAFEETSCITAMEQQAAGTPFITTRTGALTETLKNAGVYWTDVPQFANVIKYMMDSPGKWMSLHRKALQKREQYGIDKVVDGFLTMVEEDFQKKTKNIPALFDHFFYTSDIAAASRYAEQHNLSTEKIESRFNTITTDLGETVGFYEKSEERNTEIGNTHGLENVEGHLRMGRLQPVIAMLSQLPPDAHVLDYGCCVGQLTFALKARFPDMQFTGVDISEEQIRVAMDYSINHGLDGMNFYKVVSPNDITPLDDGFDAILCLEVLEHIWDYETFICDLTALAPTGRIILSTPFGPFDENSDDPDPLYQHLHNFEEQDLRDIAGEKPDFDIVYVADRPSKAGDRLGNYVWSWTEDGEEFGSIDYERKFKIQSPRQTVTACLIIRPDGDTLQKCLKSIQSITDQIVIGVDDPEWLAAVEESGAGIFSEDFPFPDKEKHFAYQIMDRFGVLYFPIESPLIQGFAAARNETIKWAAEDWILWIDDDEALMWGERARPFLRDNQFDSYGVPQHHMSAEPVGRLKTDFPSRLFRNRRGISFYGVVHEHPETVINKGAGKTFLLNDKQIAIMHNSYDTEETRRKRFLRNFPLMERDIKENPTRKLGQLLWIRDLAHMNRFEYEQTAQVSPKMLERAKEALDLWRSLLPESNSRMLKDSMPYITECVDIVTQGGGLSFRMALDVNNKGIGDNINAPVEVAFTGKVENKADLAMLHDILVKEKVDSVETTAYI